VPGGAARRPPAGQARAGGTEAGRLRRAGKLNTNGTDLLVFGKQFGNVFIGVQPTFGYEGDPMRLLFSRSASPHHGFAAYYTFLERIFKARGRRRPPAPARTPAGQAGGGASGAWGVRSGRRRARLPSWCCQRPSARGKLRRPGGARAQADAVLHFGTHGSLEFMPGKQVGMSGVCYPDSLIGDLPNLYYYAANNPSEATIAKRRSYANTISYLTPPAENAGLYKGLKARGPPRPRPRPPGRRGRRAPLPRARACQSRRGASSGWRVRVQELKELIASYQTLRESGRGPAICATIIETARQCNLDKDIRLPDIDPKELSLEGRDTVVGQVYSK